MSNAYLLERLFRTTNCLMVHNGNLEERLPLAWQNGIATIAAAEIDGLGDTDLSSRFSRLNARFDVTHDLEQGAAEALVSQLDENSLGALVRQIVDIVALIETRIRYLQDGAAQ